MGEYPQFDTEGETIYLIHYDRPYKSAGHYLGYSKDFEARMKRHRQGRGANLIKVIQKAGIDWKVVRTWPGSPKLEAELKRWHNNKLICPICHAETAYKRAEHMRNKRKSIKDAMTPKERYANEVGQSE